MGSTLSIKKHYHNSGVYGHSKILSFIFWFGYIIFLYGFRILIKIFDIIQRKRNKLSLEFRSFYSLLSFFTCITRYEIITFHPPHFLFVHFIERTINYFLGNATTIPHTANIKSVHISKKYLYQNCNSHVSKSAIDDSLNLAEIKDKNIENIQLLWITGNDEIQNMYNLKNDKNKKDTIFYIHGGAYLFGGPSHVGFVSHLSLLTQTRIAYIMYDKPVKNPNRCFKTQLDQILFTYLCLIYNYNIPSSKIILIGDSAGGGLIVSTVTMISKYIETKNDNLWSFPRGIILLSPWIDISMKSRSWTRNRDYDVVAKANPAKRISRILNLGQEAPYVSSLFAPPTTILSSILIFVSKHENVYDDSVKLSQKIKRDNNNIDLTLIEKDHMIHAWPVFTTTFPEAKEAVKCMAQYANKWFSEYD